MATGRGSGRRQARETRRDPTPAASFPPLPPEYPSPATPGRLRGTSTVPARRRDLWDDDPYHQQDQFSRPRRARVARPDPGNLPAWRTIDQRGLFVALCAALLLAACALPFYQFAPGGRGVPASLSAASTDFGSWRPALAALAAVALVAGVANALLHTGSHGAVGIFVVLRLLAFAQLAGWIAAVVERTPRGVATTGPAVTVTWVAWAAVGVAAAAVVGSFSSLDHEGR